MKNKKIVQIITIAMFATLIVWTIMTISGQSKPSDASKLGGEGSPTYTAALNAYNEEIQHGYALLTLGVLVTIAFVFITESFPIALAAMAIPCYYSLFEIVPWHTAFGGFTNSAVLLYT